MNQIERAIDLIKNKIVASEANIYHFNTELMKSSPYYVLQWADGTFMNAAMLHVSKYYLGMAETLEKSYPEEAFQKLKDTMVKDIISDSRSCVTKSSSTSHNLLENCKLEARAKLLENLEFLV